MTWHSLWAFLLLIPLFLFALLRQQKKREKHASMQFSNIALLKKMSRGLRVRFSFLPSMLKAFAILLAIIALARPQSASTKLKRNVEGIDIIMALDVSDSMLIEDMKPENRLESSKETIRKFITGRVSDRIGLVVFSGESYTRVPLTIDYEILLKSLAEVETSRDVKLGTAIGVALANSVSRLRDSTAKSRVVIFLTDGENNSGTIDPDTALEIAKGYGIRVYTIGVGRDGQAKLPVFSKDVFGRKVKRYQPMHSKVNEELLTRISKETGGKFYRATNTESLVGVFSDINKLEKTKIETQKFTKYTELYPKFLIPAVFLYLLASILQFSFFRRLP